MSPTASPQPEGMRAGHSPLGRLRDLGHAGGAHEMDVLTVTASCHAPEEVLRAKTLPPIHPRLADMLDGVLNARMRVAGDVEGADA
jgi:hypothetical protein